MSITTPARSRLGTISVTKSATPMLTGTAISRAIAEMTSVP
ncbi:unannotated protein [freshwater metagenome]|uniref:Unannotated protein n=1 Tax=freshwater metagenome TaxID=449393 RepID=A0A6J7N264_9ZZZZ